MVQDNSWGVHSLNAGESAMISRIEGCFSISKRLADMGFVRGVQLEMVKPGLPCIVAVDGVRVGLGGEHQDRIRVY
ncbi:MAG: FeoA family protein [Phycisphaerae bacterium]